jgi:type VI secretion system protein VasD
VAVDSSVDLNPDADGRPSPVVVRIYQLSSATDFLSAEFSAVYRNDAGILGKTLISKQEFVAIPGEHDTMQWDVASETRALGVLVAFRDIDHAHWRLITAPGSRPLTLLLSASTAQLQPPP